MTLLNKDLPRVLGHQFVSMNNHDWDSFAGAEPGSFIYHGEDVTLIYDPKSGVVSEIDEHGNQKDWTPTVVLDGQEGG